MTWWPVYLLMGLGVGVLAGMLGIGGGTILVTLMVWNGLGKEALPPYTLGYVFLPALVAVVIGTYVTVPMGARLAHRLPVLTLKRVLGLVLCVLATKMLFTLFSR
jgi:uncharacterized membrane protein YfcA